MGLLSRLRTRFGRRASDGLVDGYGKQLAALPALDPLPPEGVEEGGKDSAATSATVTVQAIFPIDGRTAL